MKKLSQLLLACCLAAVAIMPADAMAKSKGHHGKHKKHERPDPIIGSWVYNFALNGESPDNLINGVITFYADNTILFHDSGNLTQAFIANGETGGYQTVHVGSWERLCKNQYRIVSTSVVLARGFGCGQFEFPGCLALPAVPVLRFKTTQFLVLDPRSESATSTIEVVSHPVDDLTLTQPAGFPTFNGSWVYQKLAAD